MFSLRGLFKTAEEREKPAPVLRGSMHRAIVLKAPDDNFAQAIFILKEGFLQEEGLSRRELLRQAREAAAAYCPPRRGSHPGLAPAALFILGAATAIITLWALGLLRILV